MREVTMAGLHNEKEPHGMLCEITVLCKVACQKKNDNLHLCLINDF